MYSYTSLVLYLLRCLVLTSSFGVNDFAAFIIADKQIPHPPVSRANYNIHPQINHHSKVISLYFYILYLRSLHIAIIYIYTFFYIIHFLS